MDIKTLHAVVDDGTREIPLVNKFGKEICKVYFRPADYSILDRYNDLMDSFDDMVEPLKHISIKNDGTAEFEKDWAILKQVETSLKERINTLFDMEEADAIFATRNAFSSVGGQFFCFRVLAALGGVIEKAIAEETALSAKRMAKYMEDLESPSAGTGVIPFAGATSD